MHREFGSTTLTDSDGSPLLLSDEDLAACLAPLFGAPTLIVVSGCHSTQILPILRERGVGAFMGFEVEISEDDARTFSTVLYSELVRGATVRAAGEHTASYMERRSRPVPAIFATEPYGSMRLL